MYLVFVVYIHVFFYSLDIARAVSLEITGHVRDLKKVCCLPRHSIQSFLFSLFSRLVGKLHVVVCVLFNLLSCIIANVTVRIYRMLIIRRHVLFLKGAPAPCE